MRAGAAGGPGRLLAASAAVAAAALPAAATLLRPISLRELLGASDVVIVARVERVSCRAAPDGRELSTIVEVSVERVLKGELQPGSCASFRLPGGRRGDRVRVFEGCPEFRVGERAVLFGSRGAGLPVGEYRIAGFSAGKLPIFRDPATLAERVAPGASPAGDAGRQSIELARFLEAIGEALSGEEGAALREAESILGPPRVEPRGRGPARLVVPDPPDAAPGGEEPRGTVPAAWALALALAGMLALAARRRRAARLGAGALFLGAALAAAASGTLALAYTRTRSLGSRGPYCWWDLSSGGVTWYMAEDEAPECELELDAVEAAFRAWEDVSLCEISFRYGGPPPEGATRGFADDGYNVVFWDRSSSWDPNVLAVTAWTAQSSTGKLLDVDIGFNARVSWTTGWETPWAQPVWGVIEHEVGHLVGLAHNVEDPSSTMYPYFHPGLRTLGPDDIAGARAVYPDRTAPPSPAITGGSSAFPSTNCAVTLEGTISPDVRAVTVNGSADGVAPIEPGSTRWRYGAVVEPGVHSFSVSASDEAGNVSSPATATVTVLEGGPLIERFALADLSTGSVASTNADTVAVVLACRAGSGGALRRWLLTEDRSLAVDAATLEAAGAPAPPRVWSFSNRAEGRKYVWLWVSDEAGNVAGPAEASIVFDWQPPAVASARALDATHVLVEFDEPVLGELEPSAYALSGEARCLGAERVGGRVVLRTTPLSPGASYRVAARAPLLDGSGANEPAPGAAGAAFAALWEAPAIARVHSQTTRRTTVTYSREMLGAEDRSHYTIGNYVFFKDYWPLEVSHLGGDTYELDYWELYSPAAPEGYETYLLVRGVTDLAGATLPANASGDWHQATLRVRGLDSPPDWQAPRIESFELASLDDTSVTSSTRRPRVAVRLTESDPDGGVVRWLLSEDAPAPDAGRMQREGSARRPCKFELADTPGLHTVYAWVMDEDGNVSPAAAASIELLADRPPVAAIAPLSETRLEAPAEVAFDGSLSYDPEGAALEYYWDFGDGSTATGACPVHVFTDVGAFEVLLVVTDDQGRTAKDAVVVTVVDTTPPELDVTRLVLAGRVDSPDVTEVTVEVDGSPCATAPVAGGRYEVAVELPPAPCGVVLRLAAPGGASSGVRILEVTKDGR